MADRSTDTTTVLNPGASGDSMDEGNVYQSDGATLAKRPRVELAYAEEGVSRLVGAAHPLPTGDERTHQLLQQIVDELREIRIALAVLDD